MIKLDKRRHLNLNDYFLLKERNLHCDLLLDDFDFFYFNNKNKGKEVEKYFDELIKKNYILAFTYTIDLSDNNFLFFLTIHKEQSNYCDSVILNINNKQNETTRYIKKIISSFINNLNKLPLDRRLQHKVFINYFYKLEEINSNTINELIKNQEKISLEKKLLEYYQYYDTYQNSNNFKIAKFITIKDKFIYIKYNTINELYYKLIYFNFDKLYIYLLKSFNNKISIDENFKIMCLDNTFCMSLEITVY